MSTRSDSRSSSVSSLVSDEVEEKDTQQQRQSFNSVTAQQVGSILNEYRLSCDINNNGADILKNLILKAATSGGSGEEFSKILLSHIANVGK